MKKLIQKSTVHFIVVLALVAFFVKIPAGIIGSALVHMFDLSNPLFSAAAQEPTFTRSDLWIAIVWAPLIETLLGQLVPIEILGLVVRDARVKIMASALLFMAMHFPVVEFFPSAFAVGIVFAWAWVVKRPLGLWKTFAIVTLIHSMHNALVAAVGALAF